MIYSDKMIRIGDDNFREFIDPVVDGETKTCKSFGYMLPAGRFSAPRFQDQERVKLIPESDWDDIIAARERDHATTREFIDGCGLKPLDQNATNYCWCFGVTHSLMVANLMATGVPRRFSPASVAAPVTNFKNVGGWGSMALDYMIEHGINLEEDWPITAIDRRYYTAENKAKAKDNLALEYYRCDSWEEVASSVLAGVPVGVGYNWWGHLVCAIDIVLGSHDLVILNSWGPNWSDNGYGILTGRKKIPDMTSVAITTVLAA